MLMGSCYRRCADALSLWAVPVILYSAAMQMRNVNKWRRGWGGLVRSIVRGHRSWLALCLSRILNTTIVFCAYKPERTQRIQTCAKDGRNFVSAPPSMRTFIIEMPLSVATRYLRLDPKPPKIRRKKFDGELTAGKIRAKIRLHS